MALIEGRDGRDDVGALPAGGGAAPAGGRRRRAHRAPSQGERGAARQSPRGHAARLTLGRLAAARGEWTDAQQHALAHLDACVEGGHATYVPACPRRPRGGRGGARGRRGRGAAVRRRRARPRRDRRRPRARPRTSTGPRSTRRLREALGDEAYEAARAEGAELTIEDALEWARRARGPRRRARRRLGVAHPHRGQGRRARRRGPHQPPDRRADVHLEGDRQDPPRPHLQEARHPQPRRAERSGGPAGNIQLTARHGPSPSAKRAEIAHLAMFSQPTPTRAANDAIWRPSRSKNRPELAGRQ